MNQFLCDDDESIIQREEIDGAEWLVGVAIADIIIRVALGDIGYNLALGRNREGEVKGGKRWRSQSGWMAEK